MDIDKSDSRSNDRIIGLDVGGRVFYTHLPTLTIASTYFNARFGGDFLPGGSPRLDSAGRSVFFLDRDGDLFYYILQFLMEGIPTWPDFRSDPVLWRRLRAEADYYGLPSLTEALRTTHSVSPDSAGDRGVLYWLGTEKGTKSYCNPHDIMEVEVNGGTGTRRTRNSEERSPVDLKNQRRTFVQYRPAILPVKYRPDMLWLSFTCESACRGPMDCDGNIHRDDPLVITLRNVALRVTHYSLRFETCLGMNYWDFEASVDGVTWDTLHQARNDRRIRKPTIEQQRQLEKRIRKSHIGPLRKEDEDEVTRACHLFAEEELRGTWELEPVPSSFYRYFRFIGIGQEAFEAYDDEDDFDEDYEENGPISCMHGVGFELFGDIQEM